MKHSNKLEQRTYLQDRFEILIKKQKEGHASFNELTELDDMVNKHAAIREQILDEMQRISEPPDEPIQEEVIQVIKKQPFNLWALIKSFINRICYSDTTTSNSYYICF